jgi:hypothetical protein
LAGSPARGEAAKIAPTPAAIRESKMVPVASTTRILPCRNDVKQVAIRKMTADNT